MARVTVEDCILKVPNRFDLVMLAAQRARDISAGAKETVDRDNDKGPVVALREIAGDTIELADLQDSLVRGLQKHVVFEDDEEEETEGDLILTSEGEVEVGEALSKPLGGNVFGGAADSEDSGEAESAGEEESADGSLEDVADADEKGK